MGVQEGVFIATPRCWKTKRDAQQINRFDLVLQFDFIMLYCNKLDVCMQTRYLNMSLWYANT